MIFGLLAQHTGATFRRHIRFPQHFFSVHGHGQLLSDREPQLLPALTWARLNIEQSRRFISRRERPARDPVDSDPGARFPWSPPKIEPKLAQALSVSPQPGADILAQGELPPISPEC